MYRSDSDSETETALHVEGGADLDSTDMARARPETKAQEKNCESGRSF